MSNEIITSIIGASVVLIGIIVDGILSRKKTNELLVNSARQNEYNVTSERILKLHEKLGEFYYPIRNYLEKSSNIYDVFKIGKPNNFRTLTYLLDKKQLYDGKQYDLSVNDKAFLKQIFEVGTEIEKIIAEKGNIIDDPELVEPYIPSKKYIGDDEKFPYPKHKSLLSIAQVHLSFIRLAFDGEIEGNNEHLSPYVFPRELSEVVINKIKDLESEIFELKEKQSILLIKMKMKIDD